MKAGAVVLEVDGLRKSFGSRQVLKSGSFHAKAGRITALMGRNGAGKSTMFRIAIGRVKADVGRVSFDGHVLERPSLAEMARQGLFYCAQDSVLTDLIDVGDHLRCVAQVYEGGHRLAPAVDELRLGEFLDRRPRSLSGGERRRTSLAMALVREPSCLIMDEPYAGIAPKDRELISAGLRKLRDSGCAISISGHDAEDVLAVADEIVWVVDGTTHFIGPPDAAQVHDRFRREYLGH